LKAAWQKRSGLLVDNKFKRSQQCDLMAKHIWDCVRRFRETIFALHSVLVRSYLESCNQFGTSQYKKDPDILEQVQQKDTKNNEWVAACNTGGESEKAGMVQPGEGRLRGDVIATFNCLMGRGTQKMVW